MIQQFTFSEPVEPSPPGTYRLPPPEATTWTQLTLREGDVLRCVDGEITVRFGVGPGGAVVERAED